MPKPPEMGHLTFDPPIKAGSERFYRYWELIHEMGLKREVVFFYKGFHELHGLSFPTKAQAMLFKLRL